MKTNSTFPKTVFLILITSLTFSLKIDGQKIGVSSGIGVMTFFDFNKDSDYNYSTYKPGSNQFVKLDLNSFIPEVSFLNFSFKLEKSSGSAVVRSHEMPGFAFCGLGMYSRHMNSDFNIYKIGFGIRPLNFNIYKRIKFSGGVELNRMIRTEAVSHLETIRGIRAPIDHNVRTVSAGLTFELQFGSFLLWENLAVSPIYYSSIGLSEELDSGIGTRAIRQSIGITLNWNHASRLIKE